MTVKMVRCHSFQHCLNKFLDETDSPMWENHFPVPDRCPAKAEQTLLHSPWQKLDIGACPTSKRWTHSQQRMANETYMICGSHVPSLSTIDSNRIKSYKISGTVHPAYTIAVISRLAYFFHFAQVQGVFIVRPKLHEPHIWALWQFGNAFDTWEKSVLTKRTRKNVEKTSQAQKNEYNFIDCFRSITHNEK